MNKMFALLLLCFLHLTGFSKLPAHLNNLCSESSGANAKIFHFLFNNYGTQQNKAAVYDVLFATNEDVELYVNDEHKGTLSKKEHLYLKLPAGDYTYRAKSKNSADEYRQPFTVKAGAENEIFIDFLYFLDERKLLQASVQSSRTSSSKAAVGTTAKPEDTSASKIKEEAERIVINTLISNMVPVNGGSFVMGNNKAPAADEQEHLVTISGVQFGRYEVTQQQWEVMMGYNPSKNVGCANCPVESVSWEEVMKFIRKVNLASGKKFRLPTEAEWEYVAKMGGKAEIDAAGGQEAYIKKTAWYFANADRKTHPVGQKQPNVAGIYDLMGNVSEWCMDWYGSYYYKEDDSQKDPEGPPLGKDKVVRGGSFLDYSGDRFRPSIRDKQKPTIKLETIGFRLVLEN